MQRGVTAFHPYSALYVLSLSSIQKLLSPTGSCYMVLVQENRPAEISRILREGYGLHSEVRNLHKFAVNFSLGAWARATIVL